MNVLNLIGQVFEPAAKLIDDLHTSKEEKLEQKAILLSLQTKFLADGLKFEQEQLKAKASIIIAEAKSESWVTRNWRPVTMLALVASVLAYWFGLTPTDPVTGLSTIPLSVIERLFTLVQIGVGGYIAGRSAEKIAVPLVKVFKEREKT